MKIIILLLSLSGAIGAEAATYEQSALWNLTTAKQSFSFNQFDSTWGTLRSASLTISGSVPSGYVNITTKIFSATIRDIRSKLQLAGEGFSNYDSKQVSLLASVPFSYVQVPYSVMNYVILNNQRLVILPYITEVSTEFLYRYIGIGKTPSIVANVWAYVSKTPDIYTVISTASYYAPTSVTFTYDYLPAPVPEPSTYGLSLAILVMVYRFVRRFGLVI